MISLMILLHGEECSHSISDMERGRLFLVRTSLSPRRMSEIIQKLGYSSFREPQTISDLLVGDGQLGNGGDYPSDNEE